MTEWQPRQNCDLTPGPSRPNDSRAAFSSSREKAAAQPAANLGAGDSAVQLKSPLPLPISPRRWQTIAKAPFWILTAVQLKHFNQPQSIRRIDDRPQKSIRQKNPNQGATFRQLGCFSWETMIYAAMGFLLLLSNLGFGAVFKVTRNYLTAKLSGSRTIVWLLVSTAVGAGSAYGLGLLIIQWMFDWKIGLPSN